MPSVIAAFAKAIAATADLTVTDNGEVLEEDRVVHRLVPSAEGYFEDLSFFDLIRRVEDRHPDRPALVARYAETIEMDDLGVLGLSMKTAPTLRASLMRLERYFRLITDTAVYRLVEQNNVAFLMIEGRTPDHPALSLRNECALAGFVRNARAFVRGSLDLEYVSFRHDSEGDRDAYARYFGCPVFFGAESDAVAMSPHALNLPNQLGDKALSAFLTGQLEREAVPLSEVDNGGSMTNDLHRRLSTELSTGVPQAARIARDMGMSERTFFRRLSEEGTTFRDVVRDVQMQLARDLLERSDCSIAEVAFLTGFAEQSTFGRSFKRWVGQAPAQYRSGFSDAKRAPYKAILAGSAKRLAGAANTHSAHAR